VTALFCIALLCVATALLPQGANALLQDSDPLALAAQTQLDALASRVAEHMRSVTFSGGPRKIFVIDFSNTKDNRFSNLGSLLADDFAKSFSKVADNFEVEQRKDFTAYLKENWIGLEDLQSDGVCLTLVHSMGGAGALRGTLTSDANQQLKIAVQVEGVGPAWSSDAEIPLTEELQTLWKQPAPSYVRAPGAIPLEQGILQPGDGGVSLPACVFCPTPDYTDLARTAKYRGTVELSIIVTKAGDVAPNSVVVLRGAPFDLTKQAIDAVQKWKFKPAKRTGQSVPVRVPIDIEFQLY
jgi:TonB family protein